jgi:hypothetical protein
MQPASSAEELSLPLTPKTPNPRHYLHDHNASGEGSTNVTLLPTAFWYDNIHVVRTEHYRDFIFDPAKKLVAKGGFVEDKLSPAIMSAIKEEGMEQGWGR